MQNRARHAVAIAVASSVLALPAVGQINLGARLIDGPAILDYTTNGTGSFPSFSNGAAGNIAMNFQVHGAWNDPAERQVFSGNWFYRVQGDDRERHLINPDTRTSTGSDQIEWTFPQVFAGGASPLPVSNLSAKMGFEVGSTGPDSAFFYTYMCFRNDGVTPIHVTTFFAADIDLDGTWAGDVYSPLAISGGDRTWNLTDGSATGIMFGPGADAAGVGSLSSIIGSLTNTSFTDYLGDFNPGGVGAGDLAAVMQFERTINPGQMVCCPVYVGIGVNGAIPIVPAPAAGALFAVCLIVPVRRRHYERLGH